MKKLVIRLATMLLFHYPAMAGGDSSERAEDETSNDHDDPDDATHSAR